MFKRSLSILFLSTLMLLLAVGRLCAASEGATLATDAHKYEQGQTMTITGAGFTAGATIVMTVARPDKIVESIPGVRADSNGGFVARYVAPGINGSYLITASDGIHTADTRAADPFVGSVANYSQCANDLGLGFGASDPDPGCHWVNGDLNHNNSKYIEGDATVQRALIFTTPGQPHSVTFQYDTTKSGAHAYDFLVDDKFSEYWVSNVDMCDGMDKLNFPSCSSATPFAYPIPNTSSSTGNPETPSVEALYVAKRNMRIRGGTITGIDQPTLASGSFSSDSDMEITVHFTVDSAGADCKTDNKGVTTCPVLITFGAHISRKADWKGKTQTATASTISGSPYHVALVAADESSVGQRDNQMQANTIDAGLTLVKVVKDESVNGGTAASSLWTLSAAGPQPGTTGSFSGPGNSDLVTQVALPPGTYLLSESGGPASGYTNGTTWACDKNGDGALSGLTSITLASTDSATCTIENTRDIGTIELKKHWAGAAGATTLSIGTSAGGSNIASQSVSGADGGTGAKKVATGAYYVSETAVSGYDSTLACTDDGAPVTPGAGNSVNVTKGHNVVCTFTNTQKGTVVVVKNTVGGDGTFDFTASPTGKGIDAFSLTTSGLTATKTFNQVSAGGPYSITEGAQSGWIPISATCTSGTPSSFTLSPGGTVTCTFTNEKAGHLVVNKVTIPSGDTTVFAIAASGTGTISGGGAGTVSTAAPKDYEVSHGTYSVAETPQTGWDETANTCSGLVIAAGQTVNCTITNTKRANLVIVKNTVGGNGDFGFTATGSDLSNFIITTAGNTGTQTFTNVRPGAHSVSEAVPNGWDLTGLSCAITVTGLGTSSSSLPGLPVEQNTSGLLNISLAAGDTYSCTFTNTKRANLVVVKNTVGGNQTFNFEGAGSEIPTAFAVTTTGTTASGSGSTPFNNIRPGAKAITETVPASWDLTGLACALTVSGSGSSTFGLPSLPVHPGSAGAASVNLGAGDTVTCTFTNTKRANLIVVKNTVGGNGEFPFVGTGSEVPSSFTLATSGGTANTQFSDIIPGAKTVSETVPNGWDLTGVSCSITDAGAGTSSYTPASMPVNQGNSGGASITLAAGDTLRCTFTNTRRANLIIVKRTLGGNGTFSFSGSGSGVATNFGITTESLVGTSQFLNIIPGTKSVSETVPQGWDLTGLACSITESGSGSSNVTAASVPVAYPGTAGASGTLGAGDTVTCTFTNTKRAKLVVVKNTVGGNGTFSFSGTGSGVSPAFNITTGGTNAGGTGSATFNYLLPGSYSATESAPAGWDLTALACSITEAGSNSSAFTVASPGASGTLGAGDTMTCTFTNTKRATLIVAKTAVGGAGTFGFAGGGSGLPANFSVSSGSSQTFSNLPLGVKTIAESVPTGWELGGVDCSVTASGLGTSSRTISGALATVTLNAGDTMTCTYQNLKQATLIIVKQSRGDVGTFGFAVGGTALTPSITTTLIPGSVNGSGQVAYELSAGSYTVDETSMPARWTLTDAICTVDASGTAAGSDTNSDGISDHWALTLQWGGNATCTFTNQGPATTRTQGFWSTHTALADAVWSGGPGMPSGGTRVLTSGDEFLCTTTAITADAAAGGNQLMGGFWANIAQLSDPALKGKAGQRSDLDKARMQMLQQYLAAVLNVHAFGSGNTALLSNARAAYCGTDVTAIKNQIGILGAFNTSGDDLPFTPGASATPKVSREFADIDFWDITNH